jgi:hypothetical protein
MDKYEQNTFVTLFNRGGYILDFNNPGFDAFTLESVGIPLCQTYRQSKGKSLQAFVSEADEKQADKLLLDLFEYYEKSYCNFERETVPDEFGHVLKYYGVDYRPTYQKCKAIAERYSPSGYYADVSAKNISEAFSSDYIDKQLKMMLTMQHENPTEAIGKAKELIESCCKAILEANSQEIDKNWDVSTLTKKTMEYLKIMPCDIPDNIPAAQTMKSILGNLRAIAKGIAELRNLYGSGHGKLPNYKGLEERHAKLAVGSSLALVNFLWDSHLRVSGQK